METSKSRYKNYCKPKLADLLTALKLNVEAVSASGSYLRTKNDRNVLDLVSGFGSAILGHNPPQLVEEAVSALTQNIPICAQGTMREEAGKLSEKLNSLLSNGAEYYSNLSNSGAEAVEAAVKHAYKVRLEVISREYERLSRILNNIYYQIEHLEGTVLLPGDKDLIDFRDDLDEYNLAQFESFQYQPVMASFKGGYHGKTTSSIKLTFNKSFRESFEGLSAIKTEYIDPNHPEHIKELCDAQVCIFYYPVLKSVDGQHVVELKPVKITKLIGVIFETIMGEGGIKPLPENTLNWLAENHKPLAIPYIIDEIQTGCGRTGAIYHHQKTALKIIKAEYILLSKALGGGITKVGATLIRSDIYESDFGILHTSTFGEDDLSARVARKALDLLTENEGERLAEITTKGAYLHNSLKELGLRYPELIKDVRGCGLMLGVEFTSLEDRSPFFRSAGRQGVLSLLVASYLLHYHDIRVLAPISTMLKGNPGKQRQSIIRIQPSLCIEYSEVDRFVAALLEVCEIITSNNEFCLLAHLFDQTLGASVRKGCKQLPALWPLKTNEKNIDARLGFVVPPINVETLSGYYFPSFSHYTWDKKRFTQWWNSLSRFLEPVHVKSEYVTSNAFTVEVNLVFVPYLPEYINRYKADRELSREMRDKVQDAVTLARELGDDNIPVSMVGLGAYTSIITNNGQTVNDYEVPITTGNAYTTGLTLQGIFYAAQLKGIDLAKAKVAVVGATGNIGLVLGQILLPRVGELLLVGSGASGSQQRLGMARSLCLTDLLKSIHQEQLAGIGFENTELQGAGYAYYEALIEGQGDEFDQLRMAIEGGDISRKTTALFDELVPNLNFSNSTDLNNLLNFDIVVLATNSEKEDLITPAMVKPGAIVCCASVPSNLSSEFKNNQSYLAFEGGLAQLPENSEIDFYGMPKEGLAYGCLAETMVLGFDGQNHSFSKGLLTSEQVFHIMQLAADHGFSLGSLKFGDDVLHLIEE